MQAMQKYKEVPFWWYIFLLTFSFICGKLSFDQFMTSIMLSCSRSCCSPSGTDLYDLVFLHCGTATWRHVTKLVIPLQQIMTSCKALIALFSQIFSARLGNNIPTEQLVGLAGGFMLPGQVVSNCYVCVYLLRDFSFLLHFSLQCGAMALLDSPSHLQQV